jgi:hypothetical protein
MYIVFNDFEKNFVFKIPLGGLRHEKPYCDFSRNKLAKHD